MARWQPNTRSRLEQAAMELYLERGFEQTTVVEIAERAGSTERTFFRHFADKREVLFGGAASLQALIVRAVMDVPASISPFDAVAVGLEAAGAFFQGDGAWSRQRQTIIDANAELQARELSKLSTLASAISDALHQRGTTTKAAKLVAEAGIVVFKIAFERWLSEGEQHSWTHLIHEALDELKSVISNQSS